MYRKTYVQIDLDILKDNVKKIINQYDDYKYYFGVVKGNAYGHGEYIANSLIEAGINYLAVSSLEEAISVRKQNNEIPILCLEPVSLEFMNVCKDNNITITIHDYDYYKELIALNINYKLNIHLKLDTGMNRLGIKEDSLVTEVINALQNHSYLYLEGVYTHLASSGISDKMWDNQVETFKRMLSNVDIKSIPIIHIARSLTVMYHPKVDICNGVRLGIMMYGFNNMPKIKSKLRLLRSKMSKMINKVSPTYQVSPIELKEAFSLYSEIMQIKHLKKGEAIGYGPSYIAEEDMTIGIIPIGYADGFDKRNNGRNVIINNTRYKIIGGIYMDMIMAKIDDTIKMHDKVTLIGNGISVREVSRYYNSSAYEVMTQIGSRVPRVYIENNDTVYIKE